MRHDWIFEVLADLRHYAKKNDLPALALKVDEAVIVAQREVGSTDAPFRDPPVPPSPGRAN